MYLSRFVKKELDSKVDFDGLLDWITLEYSGCTNDLYNLHKKLRVHYSNAIIILALAFSLLDVVLKDTS